MTTYRRNTANLLAGFTLVEILVVIVIIGLLAGMTTTVVVSARRSVNNSIVTSQMAQLSMALDEYKNKFGEYPPDLSDRVAVERHLKKRWPRYNVTYDQFLQHIQDGCRLSSGTIDPDTGRGNLDGQHVWDVRAYISPLVFWLGGLPDKHGVPSGFYASPKAPLGFSASDAPISRPARAKREKPFFSFERKYLGAYLSQDDSVLGRCYYRVEDDRALWDDSLGAYVYSPAFCQGGYPIVYFRPSVNMAYGDKHFYLAPSGDATDNVSCAVPYARDNSPTWYEEKRFQLVHPGDDGLFGRTMNPSDNTPWCNALRELDLHVVPSKSGLFLEDADNLTNFVDSGTLESLYD